MAVKTITFYDGNYPEVLRIANQLGELEKRRPHDSIKRLILDCGKERIRNLKKGGEN